MSYILEALRRAEAQRSRGHVPTLNTPAPGPVFAVPVAGDLVPRRRPAVSVVLVLGALLVFGLLGLALLRWWPGPPNAAVVDALPASPAAPQPALPQADESAVLLPPAVAASVPRPSLPATPEPVAAAPAAPPVVPVVPAAAALPPAPKLAAPVAAAGPAASAVASSPAASAPILRRQDLPAALQRELPALAISGTVYSSDPAQRLLMVNGELLHEGDRIGAELVVEEIRRKDAVLRYKGQRFSVSP